MCQKKQKQTRWDENKSVTGSVTNDKIGNETETETKTKTWGTIETKLKQDLF